MKKILLAILLLFSISFSFLISVKADTLTKELFTINELGLTNIGGTYYINIAYFDPDYTEINFLSGFDYLIINNKELFDNCDYVVNVDNGGTDGSLSITYADSYTISHALSVVETDNTSIGYQGPQNLLLDIQNGTVSSVVKNDNLAFGIYISTHGAFSSMHMTYETIYNDTTNLPPSNLLQNFYDDYSNLFKFTNEITRVYFYNGSNLWNLQYVSNSNPTRPYAPTTNGYIFIGWKTLSGDYFDFNVGALNDSDYDTNGNIILKAFYILDYNADDTTPTSSSNLPTGLSNTLSLVGMNNQIGYIILFILLTIPMAILVLVKRQNQHLILFFNLMLFIAFVYFGMFQIWVIIGYILVVVLYLLSTKNNTGGE